MQSLYFSVVSINVPLHRTIICNTTAKFTTPFTAFIAPFHCHIGHYSPHRNQGILNLSLQVSQQLDALIALCICLYLIVLSSLLSAIFLFSFSLLRILSSIWIAWPTMHFSWSSSACVKKPSVESASQQRYIGLYGNKDIPWWNRQI